MLVTVNIEYQSSSSASRNIANDHTNDDNYDTYTALTGIKNTDMNDYNITQNIIYNNSTPFISDHHWDVQTWIQYLDPIISICMVIGAVIPYIPQYLSIRKTKSSKGFSTFVCLVLLISNISRIIFWFGKPFLITLVVQSIFMNITQLLLLELCVRTKRQSDGPISVERNLFSRNCPSNLWRWTYFGSYIAFLLIMTIVFAALMILFHDYFIFVELLGYVSTLSDAVLGIPQLTKNFRRKSIVGLSLAMVFMWLGGDIFKTLYFILKRQPMQFLVCGTIQIVVDLLILIQMAIYRRASQEEEEVEDKNDGQVSGSNGAYVAPQQ